MTTAVDDLIPAVLEHVQAHREQFLAEFPAGVEKYLARAAWWIVLRLVPRLVRAAYAFYVLRIEHMEVGTLVDEIRRDAASARLYLED